MTDLNNPLTAAHSLLADATQRLIELRQKSDWRNELPARCPPVLWFGNALSTKPIILTIGANPSRQEYLYDNSSVALSKMAQTNDDRALTYLEGQASRFRLLARNEKLEDVMTSSALRDSILDGYNRYFSRNPYKWFGSHKNGSPYNVEGFLCGFGASYYEIKSKPMQAIHIDLFPFATLSDFKSLQRQAEGDLFRNNWAQSMIGRLIDLLKPKALVVFGRTNFDHYSQYVDRSVARFRWQAFMKASYCYGVSTSHGVPLIGLSTNLGNPIGFNKETLGQFGTQVASASGMASNPVHQVVTPQSAAAPNITDQTTKKSSFWSRIFA